MGNDQIIKYGLDLDSNNYSKNNKNIGLTAVKVADIILDDKHPDFSKLGGWDSLGTIKYSNVGETNDINNLNTAKPIFPQLKYFPLINEIVYILSLPTKENQNFSNKSRTIKYYFSPINIWNQPNHNAVPLEDNDVILGENFVEKSNLKPLLPFEGDFILEGRFGNSIRFGNSNTKTPWSGENGNPITIIRNGQNPSLSKEGWVPTIEDINNDPSSIYLVNNQQINIDISSNNMKSFDINVEEGDSPKINIPNPIINNIPDIIESDNNIINNQPILFTGSNSQINVEEEIPISEFDLDFDNGLFSEDIVISEDIESNIITSNKEKSQKSGNDLYYDVVFQKQINNKACLIACISMLLKYLGEDKASQENISKFNTSDGLLQLSLIASKFKKTYVKRNIPNGENGYNLIKEILDKVKKPIILEKRSISSPENNSKSHFILVIGIDKNGKIITNDPGNTNGADNILQIKDLKLINGSVRILT